MLLGWPGCIHQRKSRLRFLPFRFTKPLNCIYRTLGTTPGRAPLLQRKVICFFFFLKKKLEKYVKTMQKGKIKGEKAPGKQREEPWTTQQAAQQVAFSVPIQLVPSMSTHGSPDPEYTRLHCDLGNSDSRWKKFAFQSTVKQKEEPGPPRWD